MTDTRRFAVVILAAGQGTRMRSDTHKVLHPIASRPLLLHLLDRVDEVGADKRVVVVGKGREQVEAAIAGRDVGIAIQAEQKGTGHAVQQAEAALGGYDGPVIILYGDAPFVEAATLGRMVDRLNGDGGPGVVVLAFRPADPLKYGRIILGDGDRIARMVEFKDATAEERAVTLCNSGVMAVRSGDLFGWLAKIGNDNAAGEYYLPDIVSIAAAEGRLAGMLTQYTEQHPDVIATRREIGSLKAQRAQYLAALAAPASSWSTSSSTVLSDCTINGPSVMPGLLLTSSHPLSRFRRHDRRHAVDREVAHPACGRIVGGELAAPDVDRGDDALGRDPRGVDVADDHRLLPVRGAVQLRHGLGGIEAGSVGGGAGHLAQHRDDRAQRLSRWSLRRPVAAAAAGSRHPRAA